jgi:hypothetical protein
MPLIWGVAGLEKDSRDAVDAGVVFLFLDMMAFSDAMIGVSRKRV